MNKISTLGRHRQQKRRRMLRGALWAVVYLGLLLLVSMSGYQVGTSQSATEIERQRADLAQRAAERRQLVERAARAEDEARRLRASLANLRAEYRANVPRGAAHDLGVLIEAKLAEGIAPERLAFVIESAGNERDCSTSVETRRFLARTPVSTEASESVTFADNRIAVTGEGQSARTEEGSAQAIFDPARPVTLRFLMIDGRVSSVEGLLPLTHSIILDEREFQFSAIPAERPGHIEISARTCAYP